MIGTAAGDRGDLAGLAVLGVVVDAVDADLRDGLSGGKGVGLHVVACLVLRRDTVNGRFSLRGKPTLDGEADRRGGMGRRCLGVAAAIRLHAGQRLHDAERRRGAVAAIVGGQIKHGLWREHGGDLCVLLIDDTGVGRVHGDGFGGADLERHVIAQLLARLQGDAVRLCGGESGCLGGDVVVARLKVERGVAAGAVGAQGAGRVAFYAVQRDGRTGDEGAGAVLHGAGDAAERRLREGGSGHAGQQNGGHGPTYVVIRHGKRSGCSHCMWPSEVEQVVERCGSVCVCDGGVPA